MNRSMGSSSYLFVLTFLLLFLPAFSILLRGTRRPGTVWPYYAKRLLSNPEQVLYYRLVKALPQYEIFAQVQTSRILGIKKGVPYRAWLNRIDRLSADFVVCRKDSSIVAVVELDDSSHEVPSRRKTDAKKDRALGAAGLPVIRWQTRYMPDISTIRAHPAWGAGIQVTTEKR